MQRIYLVVLSLFVFQLWTFAQPKWELNAFGGFSNYLGDLVDTPFPYPHTMMPAYGIGVSFLPKPTFAFEFNASMVNFTGDDENIGGKIFTRRSFRFTSRAAELSINTRWEPLGAQRYQLYGNFSGMISPYIFAGAGILFVDAHPDFSQSKSDNYFEGINEDMKNNAPTTAFAIPVGGGLRFDFRENFAIDLRLGVRAAFTDYLDGISFAGNPEANDWYMTGGLNFVFRLGDKDSDKDGIKDREDLCPRVAGVISAKGCPDADGDGLEDLEDLCPYKAGVMELNGCPDMDGDKIPDAADDCPGVAGSPATGGCPDLDGDGIPDASDWCPGEAGGKLLNGCPDCDHDGVINWYDKCPEVPGSPLYAGCPLELYDRDLDGVPNERDECPDLAGTAAGCPDADGDGVADARDKCPDAPGETGSLGCPVITKNELTTLEIATKAIKFETGSAVLIQESISNLQQIIPIFMKYPNYNIEIRGHTDDVGEETRNQILSEKRAAACYQFLMDNGISPDRMKYVGLGEAEPIADNRYLQGRKLNRRVEFVLHQFYTGFETH